MTESPYGFLPETWKLTPLKHLATSSGGLTPSKDKPAYWDGVIPWVSPKDMKQAVLHDSIDHVSESALSETGLKLHPVDSVLVVTRGMILAHTFPVARNAVPVTVNQDMKALQPAENLDSRYLAWMLKGLEPVMLSLTDESAHGTKALRTDQWANLHVPVPPRMAQQRIANFLDEQAARIDALIAEKERLAEAVEELRKSTISAAVSVAGAPGWSQTRLKFLVRDIVDTEHKTVPFYDDGEYLVARTTNIKGGRLVLEGAKYTDAAGYEEWTRRAVPAPGDILFTREAPAGEACKVPEGFPLCLGQRTVLIRLNHAKADASFVLWSLYGGLASRFIADLSQGSTVAHFNMPDIGNIPLFRGPLAEQRARAQALEEKLKQIDGLRVHIGSHMDRLREYRSSLISAAVTGQLDIGAFQAKLPEAA